MHREPDSWEAGRQDATSDSRPPPSAPPPSGVDPLGIPASPAAPEPPGGPPRSPLESARERLETLWDHLDPRYWLVEPRWLVLGALLLGVFTFVAFKQQTGLPDERADSYRESAGPAAAAIDGAMDDVYKSFDRYLKASRLRNSDFRGIDDLDEYRRRLLPIYRDTQRAVVDARVSISAARAAILKRSPELTRAPGTVALADNKPVEEAQATAAEADLLIGRYEQYLGSYSGFAGYQEESVELARRLVVIFTREGLGRGATLAELKDSADKLNKELRSIKRRFERLDPHSDVGTIHRLGEQQVLRYVDYVDDLRKGIKVLSLPVILDATVQFLKSSSRLNRLQQRAIATFARESRLQVGSRTLTERANKLEKRIAALGSGGAAGQRPWDRPKLPQRPERPKRGDPGERLS